MDGSIVLRDKEKQYLSEYIDNSLIRNTKQSLFICGLPGTGKTSTLHSIFNSKSVKYCYINCVELEKPKLIFNQIVTKLFRIKTNHSTAQDQLISNLENNFESNLLTLDTNQPTIFVVVDEADMIFTKNAEVFYNLVDLSYRLNSNCFSLILLSNRMDLIDTLPAKCKSRIGKNKLLFSAYSKDELQEILKFRMDGSLFQQETPLKLCAARVYSVAGDARRVLQICNNCMINFNSQVNMKFYDKYGINIDQKELQNEVKFDNNDLIQTMKQVISVKDKITSDDIKKAYNDLYNNNSQIRQFNNLKDMAKIIIEGMVELKKQQSTEILDYDLVLERVHRKIINNNQDNVDLKSKTQLNSNSNLDYNSFILSVRKELDNLTKSEIVLEQVSEGGLKCQKLEIPDDIIKYNQTKKD